MSIRFDGFTQRARNVLRFAQQEALLLNHSYIGTGHILLGFVHENSGLATLVLNSMGVYIDRARSAVEAAEDRGTEAPVGQLGLLPGAKRVIEAAVREAQRLNHESIGTEHLLLGLLQQDDAITLIIFEGLGIDRDAAREEVLTLLTISTLNTAAVWYKESDPAHQIEGRARKKLRGRRSWQIWRWSLKRRPKPRRGRKGSKMNGKSGDDSFRRYGMLDQAMSDRFDKFTERARKVLQLAQEEAHRFNHNYIGTEHILLALVRESDGVAAHVLNNLGIELHKVRADVEFILGRGERMVMGDIGLTPRAKRVIELSVDEARRLNHHYIGTEHLLLGLVREGEGIAAGVLESLGVSLEKVRAQVIEVLKSSSGYSSGSAKGSASESNTAIFTEVVSGDPAIEQLKTMFDYSIWARDRMLDAIRRLDEASLSEGEHKGVYGSIHDTLAHMAVSEWLWLQRCHGKSPMKLPKGEDFKSLDDLIIWWDDVHFQTKGYLAFLKEPYVVPLQGGEVSSGSQTPLMPHSTLPLRFNSPLNEEITYTAPDGKTRTRKVWHMLLQVPNHQTEHRAQIGTMLGQMGIEVPPTDLVVYLSEKG